MERTYIIAEAGVNHNGSLDMAKQLIDVAVQAGADAVKFQTFKADKLVSCYAPKADYQKETTDRNESQYEMLKKLELDEESHKALIDYCDKQGIQFLSTPFDMDSVELLANRFNLPVIKIPSGELTNAPMLYKIAQTKKNVILSTGMSTLGEIEQALSVLALGYTSNIEKPVLDDFNQAYSSESGKSMLKEKVILLHCTSEYPVPFQEVNLRVLNTLHHAFGLPVGLSDHTVGIAVPIAAVARGARVIEKHFTLDRSLPGPDHKASLEPKELFEMVKSIREVEAALGSQLKQVTTSEYKNKVIARKSLVALKKIHEGDIYSVDNLTVKRPGNGLSPIHYWDLLGCRAEKSYEEDEVIR